MPHQTQKLTKQNKNNTNNMQTPELFLCHASMMVSTNQPLFIQKNKWHEQQQQWQRHNTNVIYFERCMWKTRTKLVATTTGLLLDSKYNQ